MMRFNFVKHLLLIDIICVLLCYGCAQKDKITEEEITSNKVQLVEVVNPAYRSFTAEVLIAGKAMPNQKVMLHAMENGVVKEILKDIGDKVNKNDLIAELKNPELLSNQRKYNAIYESKKAKYDRLQSISEKTPALTSLDVLENAKAEFKAAEAGRQAILDRVGFLEVRSPFAGVITQRFVDKGAVVQNGIKNPTAIAIVEIQDVDPIRFTIPLPESDANAVATGMVAEITFPKLHGKSFMGKVSRHASALDEKSGTLQLEIDLPNAKGRIMPGMYGNARMQIDNRDSVLSLPVMALWIHEDVSYLKLVQDNLVRMVPLRKGLSNKDYFEVLNGEITTSNYVIVEGKGLVNEGQEVYPVVKQDSE